VDSHHQIRNLHVKCIQLDQNVKPKPRLKPRRDPKERLVRPRAEVEAEAEVAKVVATTHSGEQLAAWPMKHLKHQDPKARAERRSKHVYRRIGPIVST